MASTVRHMIFRRRGRHDPSAAIESFWRWWATARPRAEKLIDGTPDDDLVAELHARVSAIHPDLQWEFTAGSETAHLLVISSFGDSALRSLAERWRRGSPAPDKVFGYAAARPGRVDALDGKLEFDGYQLDLGLLRFAAEVAEYAVHVQVWHPTFPLMEEGVRRQVAYLSLDWLLGEDAVEIWVGEIAVASAAGPSLTGRQLAGVVASLVPADGVEHWCNVTGTSRGKPMVAMTRVPLKAARWPGYDLHIRIDVPYRSRDDYGFPGKDIFPALHALEDRIMAFADGAVVVAHETCDGVRSTHLYAERRAAAHALEPVIAGWPDGRVRMTVAEDPGWKGVGHLC